MTCQEEIAERVRSYIADSFLEEPQAAALQNGDNLLNVLDSLQLLRLVVQLEPWFGVQVDDRELTPENFGSIDKIADFVARRTAGG